MAKEELIQFEGLVTEILPDARYRVQLDAGHEIVAYTAGKMKKNRIKTLGGRPGDDRDVALRPGEGPPDFPPQGRAPGWRSTARCAAARPVPPPLSPHNSSPAPRMTPSCQRGSAALELRQNRADQKIVHLRIVLKARFA